MCPLKVPRDVNKRRTLNAAQRWLELDYRCHGGINEYEWYNWTPLATAAIQGHPQVVEYLLRQGADPTLEVCYSDNAHFHGALAVAKANGHNSRCIQMLELAAPFWKRHGHSSSHFSGGARVAAGHPHNPSSLWQLKRALDDITCLPRSPARIFSTNAAEPKPTPPARAAKPKSSRQSAPVYLLLDSDSDVETDDLGPTNTHQPKAVATSSVSKPATFLTKRYQSLSCQLDSDSDESSVLPSPVHFLKAKSQTLGSKATALHENSQRTQVKRPRFKLGATKVSSQKITATSRKRGDSLHYHPRSLFPSAHKKPKVTPPKNVEVILIL